MAGVLQHLRSSTLAKRPNPASMVDGQVAINYASGSPGMFFKDSNGSLVKVGPVHVGSGAPNAVPASGGTAGNSLGEQWLDTSGGTYVFKIWDGSAWRSEAGEFVNVTGDVMTGALGIIAGSAGSPGLYFSGDPNTGIYSPGADQVAISTNGTGRLYVDASGNVAVGTNSISGTFQVNKASATEVLFSQQSSSSYARLKITNDSTNTFELIQRGSAATGGLSLTAPGEILTRGATPLAIFTESSQPIAFGTNNTERMRLDANGRLGLGTSIASDGCLLTLQESASLGAAMALRNRNSTQTWRVAVDAAAVDDKILAFIDGGTSTVRMALTDTGRLGIGTSSPATTLDVAGSPGTSTTANLLTLRNQTPASVNNIAQMQFFCTNTLGGGEPVAAIQALNANASGNNSGDLIFATSSYGTATTPSERVRIDYQGRLGIGTTGPGHQLDVVSASTSVAEFSGPANATVEFKGSGFVEGKIQCGGELIVGSTNNYPVAFVANNTERARIDSSGRLLVGTSSTSSEAKLLVQGGSTGSGAALHLQRNATTASAGSTIGYLRFANSADNAGATIVAEGDGTWTAGTSHPTRLTFSTTADGASSPTERMRITSGGRIALGGQGAPYGGAICDTYSNILGEFAHVFRQDHASGYGIGIGIDGIYLAYFYPNKDLSGAPVGSISQDGSVTSYNTTSDYRLKENVAPLTGAINRLNQLQVRRFNFIANPGKTVDGFIAHEVQAVVPECVTGTKDAVDDEGNPVYQGIDQSKLVPLLTAALQEALQKIEELETRLTAAGL
jgi:hypothetical protein